MPRCAAVLVVVLLGCNQAPAPASAPAAAPVVTAPAKAEPAAPTARVAPAPIAQAPVAQAPATPTAPPPPIAGVRDKHPIDGMPECLEMYSACSPDGKGGQTCTSAQFTLACGQTGEVPGGDTLRCVCP